MMALCLKAAIYALQILSFFLIAGPVMAKTERRRTLATHPSWVAAQHDFLRAHSEVDLRPFRVAALAQVLLLVGAAAAGSRPLLFAVHTVLFFLICVVLYVHYDQVEKRVRALIPENPPRRAVLQPRRLTAFLPSWVLWALGATAAGNLAFNAWGYASGGIAPARALGNALLLCGLGAVLGGLLHSTLRRAACRFERRDRRERPFDGAFADAGRRGLPCRSFAVPFIG